MSKNDLHSYGKQNLIDLATFWRRLINKLEIKNPDNVLPEMRQALAETEARLEGQTSVSI